jgi:mRNA interferase RelE/StbE
MGGRAEDAGPVVYRIVITPTALKMLQSIRNRDIRDALSNRITGLATDPDKQGKALAGPLRGFRSLRAYRQRYRILYRVERDVVSVTVVALGIRKEGDRQDVYALAKKLMTLGLLGSH